MHEHTQMNLSGFYTLSAYLLSPDTIMERESVQKRRPMSGQEGKAKLTCSYFWIR